MEGHSAPPLVDNDNHDGHSHEPTAHCREALPAETDDSVEREALPAEAGDSVATFSPHPKLKVFSHLH